MRACCVTDEFALLFICSIPLSMCLSSCTLYLCRSCQALTQNGLNLILEFDISPNGYTGHAPDVDFAKEPGMVSVRRAGWSSAQMITLSVFVGSSLFSVTFRQDDRSKSTSVGHNTVKSE